MIKKARMVIFCSGMSFTLSTDGVLVSDDAGIRPIPLKTFLGICENSFDRAQVIEECNKYQLPGYIPDFLLKTD